MFEAFLVVMVAFVAGTISGMLWLVSMIEERFPDLFEKMRWRLGGRE